MSEEFFCTSNDVGDFLDFIGDKNINHLLLGNGFGLSHPDLKDSFKFCWEAIFDDIKAYQKWEKTEKECHEKFLNRLRLIGVESIIKEYVKRLSGKSNGSLRCLYDSISYSCGDFLKKFKDIHTLNYDPILYFEFLKLLKMRILFHQDGFSGKDWENQSDIVKKLECASNKFMYLHGNYFFHINYENCQLKKLDRNSITYQTIEKSFEDSYGKPFLILEGRWKDKETLIKKYKYLNFCYEQLQTKTKTDNLLVFGVSFSNDEHILYALNDSEYENIYITCRDCEAKKKIKEKIENLNLEKLKNPECVKYIKISDNVIWKEVMKN